MQNAFINREATTEDAVVVDVGGYRVTFEVTLEDTGRHDRGRSYVLGDAGLQADVDGEFRAADMAPESAKEILSAAEVVAQAWIDEWNQERRERGQ